MHFYGIVSAKAHAGQLLVGKMLHHFQKARVGAEQILAEVGSALDKIFLILSVADLSQSPYQDAVAIVANQAIPVRSPDDLDDIPSRATEDGFEFLNDFAVATYRAVETLQVAVDHENQIVQILARGQSDGSERLRFVHFAVAREGPHLTAGGFF